MTAEAERYFDLRTDASLRDQGHRRWLGSVLAAADRIGSSPCPCGWVALEALLEPQRNGAAGRDRVPRPTARGPAGGGGGWTEDQSADCCRGVGGSGARRRWVRGRALARVGCRCWGGRGWRGRRRRGGGTGAGRHAAGGQRQARRDQYRSSAAQRPCRGRSSWGSSRRRCSSTASLTRRAIGSRRRKAVSLSHSYRCSGKPIGTLTTGSRYRDATISP